MSRLFFDRRHMCTLPMTFPDANKGQWNNGMIGPRLKASTRSHVNVLRDISIRRARFNMLAKWNKEYRDRGERREFGKRFFPARTKLRVGKVFFNQWSVAFSMVLFVAHVLPEMEIVNALSLTRPSQVLWKRLSFHKIIRAYLLNLWL